MAQDQNKTMEQKPDLETIKVMSKSENMSQYQRDLHKWARNVDKRYAWVVLIALWFMMNGTLGPYRIYGLIYAKTTTDGIYTREEASQPVSAIFTVENLAGPFVSIIAYHISYRHSMLIGGLLLVLGNGLATLSNSLIVDVILLGVVQGIGYAFIFMPFMEIINSYFLKYRNMALGIALCGGTVSVFYLSPIFHWVLETFDWRYGYLATSLVCCLNIIMVPLLKPNPKPQKAPEPTALDKAGNPNYSGGTLSRYSFKAFTYQNSIRRQSTILIARHLKDRSIERHSSVISVNPFASTAGLERKISRSVTGGWRNNPNVGSTDGSDRKVSPVAGKFSTPTPTRELYETVSIGEVDENESEFDISVIWDVLKTPGFHLIWYNELVYFWVFSIYCLVLVDYGIDRGCSKEESEALLSYQSIGEIIGRLVLTVLVDLRFLSNKNVVILVLLIMGGLMVLVTQVTGYLWMLGITVSLSAFSSLLYILLNGLLVDFLGERRVTIGYGMASFIGGALMSFRPQAVGYFRDTQGSYDPLMICLALSCAAGSVFWIVEPLVTRLVKKCGRKDGEQSISNASTI